MEVANDINLVLRYEGLLWKHPPLTNEKPIAYVVVSYGKMLLRKKWKFHFNI